MGRGVVIALAALLFISLGLNIFSLGHMSGRMLAGGHRPSHHSEEHGPRGGFEDPFRVMRYAEEVSPELRDRFRQSFRTQLPAMREEHRKVGGLRRELGVLMSAQSWDGAAINAKLEEIRLVQENQEKAFTDAFLDVFESLPADQRKQLIDAANKHRAERFKARKGRFGDRRGPPPGEGPPPEDEDQSFDDDAPPPPEE